MRDCGSPGGGVIPLADLSLLNPAGGLKSPSEQPAEDYLSWRRSCWESLNGSKGDTLPRFPMLRKRGFRLYPSTLPAVADGQDHPPCTRDSGGDQSTGGDTDGKADRETGLATRREEGGRGASMGCALSGKSRGGEAMNVVDMQLMAAQEAERYHYKVLMLGAGESGKSTFGKQLRMMTKGAVAEREKKFYRKAIRQNLVECMRTLLDAGESLGIPLADPSLRNAADRVRRVDLVAGEISPSLGRDIVKLWRDRGVQRTWARKDQFWILDSTPYYMRDAVRLTANNFTATEEDMVMTRVITTGVGMIEIGEPPFKYTVVDVGGQRNERKKWLHCFDDVKAIVFVVSLAGYNQVMFEDSTQNRLLESLELYEQVVSNPLFRDTPIHVLLNKTDLFEEMLRDTPLTTCFPEYQGPPTQVRPAISFVEGKCVAIMQKCCPQKKRPVVTPICARLRQDVKLGWKDITESVRTTYASEFRR